MRNAAKRTRRACRQARRNGRPARSQGQESRPLSGRHTARKRRPPPPECGQRDGHEADQRTTKPGAPQPRSSRSGRPHQHQRQSRHAQSRWRRRRWRRLAPPGTGSRAVNQRRQRQPERKRVLVGRNPICLSGSERGRWAGEVKGWGTAGMEAPCDPEGDEAVPGPLAYPSEASAKSGTSQSMDGRFDVGGAFTLRLQSGLEARCRPSGRVCAFTTSQLP